MGGAVGGVAVGGVLGFLAGLLIIVAAIPESSNEPLINSFLNLNDEQFELTLKSSDPKTLLAVATRISQLTQDYFTILVSVVAGLIALIAVFAAGASMLAAAPTLRPVCVRVRADTQADVQAFAGTLLEWKHSEGVWRGFVQAEKPTDPSTWWPAEAITREHSSSLAAVK